MINQFQKDHSKLAISIILIIFIAAFLWINKFTNSFVIILLVSFVGTYYMLHKNDYSIISFSFLLIISNICLNFSLGSANPLAVKTIFGILVLAVYYLVAMSKVKNYQKILLSLVFLFCFINLFYYINILNIHLFTKSFLFAIVFYLLTIISKLGLNNKLNIKEMINPLVVFSISTILIFIFNIT